MPADRLPLDQRVELFVVDADNSLTGGPALPLNLTMLLEVQARSMRSRKDGRVPPVALVTGRPQAFLEALQQMVASTVPGVFEFGYGLYDLQQERCATNPAWTDADDAVRASLVARCEDEFGGGKRGRVRPGNRTAVTIVPVAPDSVESLHYPSFKVSREFAESHVLHTGPTTIDFVPRDLHKGLGLVWLAEVLQVPAGRVAVIGASTTDVPMFREAGVSFAPLNAPPAVKAEASVVTRGGHAAGVLEAYDALIAHNETV